jgi:hypothetical protein
MTTLENALARPEFESVDLRIDPDETHRYIEQAVKGLSTADADDVVKYRTTDGMLVAIVGARPAGSETANATLAYRTEPAVESATRKAAKIRDALEAHVVEE